MKMKKLTCKYRNLVQLMKWLEWVKKKCRKCKKNLEKGKFYLVLML